ncbi:caspase family protein [Leptolyngbya sp. AN03gr2]|uniref:caspase family protein n=1 Tax=unclassified Leptolyngbya TaxID=2650499 RepID=UPI003D313D21
MDKVQRLPAENEEFMNGYALLIGVGSDLPVTVKDATAVRDILVDSRRAAYSPDKVHLLVDAIATRAKILESLDLLAVQVNQNPDSTVIIYYSGHGGVSSRTGEYFLIPYDYNSGDWAATSVSGTEFTKKIEALQVRKLVVILDCCHAGGIPQMKGDETFVKAPIPPDLLHILEGSSGRVVVASSHDKEYSYTGTPFSVFTTCLIEALQGRASVVRDGYARILDVLVYLFDQVPKRTSDLQHPFVKKILDLGDNFPLCYYAGGSKYLPGELQSFESNILLKEPTPSQLERLKQKRDALLAEWSKRTEKLKRLHADLAIEAATTIKFQLEQQLIEEELKLARLGENLDNIEKILN